MGTSPMTAIAGIFGATQEARAAKESMRILNEGRVMALNRSKEYDTQFTPFVDQSREFLTQAGESVTASQGMLAKLITQTQGMETGEGLSSSDRIAYEDAAKLLNEQMVGTGNLRSGAAAFGQSELLRRVVADASQRNFGRQVAKMQLLFGGQQAMAQGAGQFGQLGSVAGQLGLGGKQLSAGLLQNGLGFSSQLANAELRKGAALSNQIVSYGVAADEIKDTMRESVSDFMSVVSGFTGGGGGGAAAAAGGGGGGGAGMAAMFSDRRLKRDVAEFERVGNITVHTFTWRETGHHGVGVIAQDVQRTHPHAVSVAENGFLVVRYDLLGPAVQASMDRATRHLTSMNDGGSHG